MNLELDNNNLDSIDLPFKHSVFSDERYQYLFWKSGVEHYRVLNYISSLFENITICDIGTKHGLSAIALANKNNHVYSYDLVDKLDSNLKKLEQELNVDFFIRNCLEAEEDKHRILSSKIVMLDTDHDGFFENKFYDFLVENNYKGLLILDDINLNDPMIKFWNRISQPKFDITRFGHHSGTGIVEFN
jgi:hypothetical protein